jgi:hypothetical protein
MKVAICRGPVPCGPGLGVDGVAVGGSRQSGRISDKRKVRLDVTMATWH